MTNSYRSNFTCELCVCVRCLPDGVPQCKRWHAIERLTVCPHIVLLSCVSIHTWCHLSPSPPLFLCSFPACQANKPNQALISGSVFTFYCILWHPLISLIPIWYQIIDTVQGCQVRCSLQRLSSVLDLRGCVHPCVSLTLSTRSLFLSTAHAICMLGFCFMWLASHKVNLWPFSANTSGVILSQPGIVRWLLLEKRWNTAYQI